MKLVTVAVYYDSPTAWIALNQLKSEEMNAYIENESLVQNVWQLGEATGQIHLRVAESDLDRAQQILGEGSKVDFSELDRLAMETKPEDESKPLFRFFYPEEGEETMEKDLDCKDEKTIDEGLLETDSEDTLNVKERLVDRALKGAVVSFLFLPLALLVTYLLFQIFLREEPIRPKYRKKLLQAYALHLPVFAILVFLMRFILQLQ